MSPFGQHPHGHPQFNPQKLGTKFTVVISYSKFNEIDY